MKTKKMDLFTDKEYDNLKGNQSLKVNSEFKRRYEHNSKRRELERLESKYGKNPNIQQNRLNQKTRNFQTKARSNRHFSSKNSYNNQNFGKEVRNYDNESLISEDFESEDSTAELLNDGDLVLDFMKVYSKLKKKNQDIYKENQNFYSTKQKMIENGGLGNTENGIRKKSGSGKNEIFNIQKQFLEEDGREETEMPIPDDAPVQVQKRLKEAFKNALLEKPDGKYIFFY